MCKYIYEYIRALDGLEEFQNIGAHTGVKLLLIGFIKAISHTPFQLLPKQEGKLTMIMTRLFQRKYIKELQQSIEPVDMDIQISSDEHFVQSKEHSLKSKKRSGDNTMIVMTELIVMAIEGLLSLISSHDYALYF
jgi:hypothetical protein